MSGVVDEIVASFVRWARERPDVTAVALVGSQARREARPDSDVDVLLLSSDPGAYEDSDAWIASAPCRERAYVRRWGRSTEHRLLLEAGPEVELGVVGPEWATERPVDAGTRRVVSGGMVPLYDPCGALAGLVRELGRDYRNCHTPSRGCLSAADSNSRPTGEVDHR